MILDSNYMNIELPAVPSTASNSSMDSEPRTIVIVLASDNN
jgi:hypothetical protein